MFVCATCTAAAVAAASQSGVGKGRSEGQRWARGTHLDAAHKERLHVDDDVEQTLQRHHQHPHWPTVLAVDRRDQAAAAVAFHKVLRRDGRADDEEERRNARGDADKGEELRLLERCAHERRVQLLLGGNVLQLAEERRARDAEPEVTEPADGAAHADAGRRELQKQRKVQQRGGELDEQHVDWPLALSTHDRRPLQALAWLCPVGGPAKQQQERDREVRQEEDDEHSRQPVPERRLGRAQGDSGRAGRCGGCVAACAHRFRGAR